MCICVDAMCYNIYNSRIVQDDECLLKRKSLGVEQMFEALVRDSIRWKMIAA